MFSSLGAPELLFILVVILAISLVVLILYLMALQRCLNRVSQQNREMEPGMIWLNLIPLFQLGWHIYTVIKIANSVTKEAEVRGITDIGDGARGIGLAMCILNITSIIPFVSYVTSVAGLVCWIIYWVKIAGISKKLASPVQSQL